MNAAAPDTVTPADLRAFANLPKEVPEDLLATHIEAAARDLARRTGLDGAPDGHEAIWREAMIARALASVFPWLNTFAVDGAAGVARLEGELTYRFLDVDDVNGRVSGLMEHFRDLVDQLIVADTRAEAGGIGLSAV